MWVDIDKGIKMLTVIKYVIMCIESVKERHWNQGILLEIQRKWFLIKCAQHRQKGGNNIRI